MNIDSKIYIAGHNGMLGSAVVQKLKESGYQNLVTRNRDQLNLTNSQEVSHFFNSERPDCVIDCAAKVGGIKANMTYPAEFLFENLQIQNNLIWSAKEVKVEKFLFVGSACIYPSECLQPMKEEYFLQGRPEVANEAYAIAKISGIKLCEYIHREYNMNFISCVPTNIYGENANFDQETAHVIPSLLSRIHDAKVNNTPEVVVWGSGKSRREFLYADDLAQAMIYLLDNYDGDDLINIGTGEDISINDLAVLIKSIVGYEGNLVFDATKPDGIPRRQLDSTRLNDLGWKHSVDIEEGIIRTYKWYLNSLIN